MSFDVPLDGTGKWSSCLALKNNTASMSLDLLMVQRGVALRLGVATSDVAVSDVMCTDETGTIVVYSTSSSRRALQAADSASSNVQVAIQMSVSNVAGEDVADIETKVRNGSCSLLAHCRQPRRRSRDTTAAPPVFSLI